MKGLIVAIQFLTRLPTPRIKLSGDEFAASMRWFPVAGLIVGLIVAGGAWVGAQVDPWLGALVGLVLWVTVTGALHLDGLGDVADGLGAAHKDRERLLAVLADPHVGSFGVCAITLQIVCKLVLLQLLIADRAWLPLILTPFVARIGPLFWARMLPSLHDGLAACFRLAVRPVDLAIWLAALFAAGLALPPLIFAAALVPLWGRYIVSRLGGMSGDGHGAGIELIESSLLAAALIWVRLA